MQIKKSVLALPRYLLPAIGDVCRNFLQTCAAAVRRNVGKRINILHILGLWRLQDVVPVWLNNLCPKERRMPPYQLNARTSAQSMLDSLCEAFLTFDQHGFILARGQPSQ